MTQEHPITPPSELMQQWAAEYWGNAGELLASSERYIATQAARWGADQELEACCEWLEDADLDDSQKVSWVNLRAARRPKPPSLKERALKALEDMLRGYSTESAAETIRCFIKSLPDES